MLSTIHHPNLKKFCLSGFIALSCCAIANPLAQSKRSEEWSPEKELASFKLQEGFVIELVASEEHGVINPIDLTFDDAGRLWTQTARMYPMDPTSGQNWNETLKWMKDPKLGEKHPKVYEILKYYKRETRGTDQILILDNPQKTATKPLHVWAEGLALPQSIMPYKNGCYVAHGSEFFYLEDTNGDGKEDKQTTVMSGFGFFDTHTMAHSIVRGPGGWLNFSHGALNSGMVKLPKSGLEKEITYAKNLRVNLDHTNLEILNTVRDNVWGYQVRENGQWYATSANDGGLSVLPMEDQTSIQGIGGDVIRDYQPILKSGIIPVAIGGSGISGLAFSEDGEHSFPANFKNVAILANPVTHTLNCVQINRSPDGVITAQRLPDLLKSTDEWFRPVNIEFGPDGCLYIADFYDKVISHNEVPVDHPDRDHKLGRIWRIRHVDQKPYTIPNVMQAPNAELINHLSGPTLWEKRAAWHQIVDRNATELIPQLRTIAANTALDKTVRIVALWSLEGLKAYDLATLQSFTSSADGDLRREGVRSLARLSPPLMDVVTLTRPLIDDANCMVRSQVLRTLEEINKANVHTVAMLVYACRSGAPNNDFGGNYESNFERFLARKALEQYPQELASYLASSAAKSLPVEKVLWALQALPMELRTPAFINVWNKASKGTIDPDTFIAVTKMMDHPDVQLALEPTFAARSEELLKLSLDNNTKINGPAVALFYKAKIATLLNGTTLAQQLEGIDLIHALRAPRHANKLMQIINTSDNPSLRLKALEAMVYNKTISPEFFRDLVADEKNKFELRLHALAAVANKKLHIVMPAAHAWIPKLSESQKNTLVHQLSFTHHGNVLLRDLYDRKLLTTDHWTFPSAHRTFFSHSRHATGKHIRNVLNDKELKERERLRKLADTMAEEIPKLKGNPDIGKAIFASCLTCHKVGDQGHEIAPPLDGSANRNLHHLLTAVVAPDEAYEGAYGLHSAVRKDGSFVEGLLVKKNSEGVTIATPGGNRTFIAASELHSHSKVHGRSFMPRSFSSLPAQTLADLAAYIKSLN